MTYQGDEPEMTREEFLARQRAGMPAEVRVPGAVIVGPFSGRIENNRIRRVPTAR